MKIHSVTQETVTACVKEGRKIVLSDCDQLAGIYPLTLYYSYESSNNMDFESMKASLKKLLSFYPVMSGNLIFRPSGGLDIECSNRGVQLIKAEADGPLRDLNMFDQRSIPHDIVTPIDISNPLTEPVCKIQLTYFTDNGLMIGFTAFHCLFDGCAAFELLANWGKLHRNLPLHPPSGQQKFADL